MKKLSEDDQFKLKVNPIKAYGTTMLGSMAYKNKVIVIELGDGGSFIVKRNKIIPAVEDDDDTVANITYSMCGDNVYTHMHGAIYPLREVKSVMVLTDGVINPYQSYPNFYKSFADPITKMIRNNQYDEVEGFIEELGLSKGLGDDVSLGLILIK